MACSVDGRLYTLFACLSVFRACLDGRRGCHCPICCTNGIRYLPWLSLIPKSMGSPLHVMSTSSSLKTDTPSFVKTETVPLSAILPTLIKDKGKSWNVSVHALLEQKGVGRGVGSRI